NVDSGFVLLMGSRRTPAGSRPTRSQAAAIRARTALRLCSKSLTVSACGQRSCSSWRSDECCMFIPASCSYRRMVPLWATAPTLQARAHENGSVRGMVYACYRASPLPHRRPSLRRIAMTIRIGISGWRYAGWREHFYPPKLAQSKELEFASRQVQTIEINGSHYSLQTPTSYQKWHDATPEDFVFAVKGPRYLTHMLRFRDEASLDAMANFFASGLLCLGSKLGPILWQFPPTFKFEAKQFEAFLAALPKDTDQAAAVARKHDDRVKNPQVKPVHDQRLRHAIEIRHASFCDEAYTDMLRRHGAAVVVSDSVADWPYAEDVTADFVYLRLHGTETLYSGAYSDE